MRKIVEMNKEQADSYINWKYDYPYEFYNIPEYAIEETLEEIFEDDSTHYFAVLDDEGKLFGVYSYIFKLDKVEIGLGIRPEDTGKGLGEEFVRDCINFVRNEISFKGDICLRVVDWNKRAINLYKKLGFVAFDTEHTKSFCNSVTFICMKLINK
ncbi:GNAT family N-acetyltransferase [Paraclostridium bifermentans]|uniref:GNAT family N-acetyltransferase n=1 Tax=Paraclostridium bifermentans TaxID=1490 RepID=UPI00359C7AA1